MVPTPQMQAFRDLVPRPVATSTQRKFTAKRNLEQDHGEKKEVSEVNNETPVTPKTRQQQAIAEAISTAISKCLELLLGILFPVLLYNISPFWLPNLVQAEYNLDEQRLLSYVEAMERATISEMLAYLMAVGLQAVHRGPTGLLQNLVFDKESVCFFSFLVFARNQKNWL